MNDDKKLKAMAEYLAEYLDTRPILNAETILAGIKDFELALAVAREG